MKHILPVLLLFAICQTLAAQPANWHISGRVLDESGAGLPGASVAADASAQVRTDSSGRFDLSVPTKPKSIIIRCVGYFPQRFPADTLLFANKTARLQVKLVSSAVSLPEISISSKPTESIFEEDFKTDLLDYAFAGKNLLLLVREGKKYYLRLTTDGGRKLSEIRLPGDARLLHKSCLGNFHAVADDWVWEASLSDIQIDTFPRYPAKEFHKTVEPCVTELGGHLFFRQSGPFRQSVRYTRFDPDHRPHPFAYIRDKIAEQQLLRRYRGILNAYMKTIPDVDRDDILDKISPLSDPMQATNPDLLSKMAETNELVTAIGFFNQLTFDSVYAPLVTVNQSLYILDHVNDRLRRYSPTPPADSTITLTYHHEPNWHKEVLTDPILNRVYGRFSDRGDVMVLKEINLESGKSGKKYHLTSVPHIADNFKIRNGTLYCLAQPDVNVPNKKLLKINIFKFAD
jgi:hypothetical protein